MSRRKKRSPYFIEASVLADGSVKLVDDDGEIFHVELFRDEPWPIVSRQVRQFEMREAGKKAWPQEQPRPPAPSGPPRLVKG